MEGLGNPGPCSHQEPTSRHHNRKPTQKTPDTADGPRRRLSKKGAPSVSHRRCGRKDHASVRVLRLTGASSTYHSPPQTPEPSANASAQGIVIVLPAVGTGARVGFHTALAFFRTAFRYAFRGQAYGQTDRGFWSSRNVWANNACTAEAWSCAVSSFHELVSMGARTSTSIVMG